MHTNAIDVGTTNTRQLNDHVGTLFVKRCKREMLEIQREELEMLGLSGHKFGC
jgi:hypothetical protein